MAVNLLREGKAERHKDSRPDDGVEPDNLFTNKMHISRPEFFVKRIVVRTVAERGDIVCKGVNPYIYYVFWIECHRYAPGKACARDAQVLKTLVDKAYHFIFAAFRLYEVGVVMVKLKQPVCIFGEAEEIRFFVCHFHLAAAVGAPAVFKLRLCPERLARGAVPALVHAFVNIAAVVKLFKYLLYGFYVVIVGCADKLVV